MALTQGEKTLLGVAAAAAGTFGLYYLIAGAGKEKNAALIPDSIEDRLDMVVEYLNGTFGKSWGGYAINALQDALPAPLVALARFAYAAEQQHNWSGMAKQNYARALWQQAYA